MAAKRFDYFFCANRPTWPIVDLYWFILSSNLSYNDLDMISIQLFHDQIPQTELRDRSIPSKFVQKINTNLYKLVQICTNLYKFGQICAKSSKIIENWWTSIKIYENLWKSMKIWENWWKSVKIYENLWKWMTIYENLWKSMKIYENLWKSMKIDGNLGRGTRGGGVVHSGPDTNAGWVSIWPYTIHGPVYSTWALYMVPYIIYGHYTPSGSLYLGHNTPSERLYLGYNAPSLVCIWATMRGLGIVRVIIGPWWINMGSS